MDIYTVREELLRRGKRLCDIRLRVAYYARVSTEKDAQLHSLSAQKEYFENKIAQNPNWTAAGGYVDEGISATAVKNRANFLKMIEDAKLHKFDLILTKEITRFARNTLDSLAYTQELLRCGVGVYFENDGLNTLEPDSELRLTIMSGIAQEESRKISDRVSFGFKRAIERGSVLGNDSIWGYRKERGRLVIVPEEAEMVRTVFDMYVNENIGIRAIAKALTERGYRNSGGNPISFSTVKGILVNPKYKGCYCGNKTHKIDFRGGGVKRLPKDSWVVYEDNAAVPPIVSPEIWTAANRKLDERSGKTACGDKAVYRNKYLYSGKLVCGEHGTRYHHTIYRYKSGNKELWTCREYANGNGCQSPIVYSEELDAVVSEVYGKIVREKTALADELAEIYLESGNARSLEKMKRKTEAEIKALFTKKDKLLDLSADGRLSNEEFEHRNNAFNARIEEKRAELSAIVEEEEKNHDFERTENLRNAVGEELKFAERFGKNVFDSLVDKIVVLRGNSENTINLKIFLKVLPADVAYCAEKQLLLGSGTVIRIRGTRAKKEIELAYELYLLSE